VARLAEEALAVSRRVGARMLELGWLTASIGTNLALGQWKDALDLFEQLRAVDDVFDWSASNRVDVAMIHARRGELERAREVVESFSWAADADNPEMRAQYQAVLAGVLVAEGKPADAMDAAQRAVAERPGLGLVNQAVKRGLVTAVEAAMTLGDAAKADELLGVVREAKPGEVTPYLRAHAARLGSRVAAMRGERATVEQGFAAAADGFREIAMPFDLGVTLLEHAEWLNAEAREEEAEPLLAEARTIFEGLRASPWLERVRRTERAERQVQAVG
jgi:tetratricopeptide (TPR) repeat protein